MLTQGKDIFLSSFFCLDSDKSFKKSANILQLEQME